MIQSKSTLGSNFILFCTNFALLFSFYLPLSIQAATGEFDYYTSQGTGYGISNPPPGTCFSALYAVDGANGTDQPIQVYSSPDCNGLVTTIPPGVELSVNFNSARAGQ